MSNSSSAPRISLHLPSLSISGFRGIRCLQLPRLGRVTLIVGKNGVGKTTILEAIRVYATRGKYSVLSDLLRSRGELGLQFTNLRRPPGFPDWSALFFGRSLDHGSTLSIGPKDNSNQIRIESTLPTGKQMSSLPPNLSSSIERDDIRNIQVQFGDNSTQDLLVYVGETRSISRRFGGRLWNDYYRSRRYRRSLDVACESLGPGLVENIRLAEWWDSIVLTKDQDYSLRALSLVLKQEIQGVAVRRSGDGREIVVRDAKLSSPVPLQSLGDGAIRFFAASLALANSRAGFLTIDEAENGIHYAIQRDYWRMIIDTAKRNNVQVIATTHGWDSLRGFAEACRDFGSDEGVLFRLEKSNDELSVVEYPMDELLVASKQGIEVR